MRGTDCASRYVRVPSDEDEDSVGRRLNSEQNELGSHKPNEGGGNGASSTVVDVKFCHDHRSGALSWKRRACFAASLVACFAYVVVMLKLPCEIAPCPSPVASKIADSRWTSAPNLPGSTTTPEVTWQRTVVGAAQNPHSNFTVDRVERRTRKIAVR